MTKILIVEDEPALAQVVKEYLEHSGFEAHIIDNGLQVLPWVMQQQPDLIILDIMLPGIDGLQVFEQVRSVAATPIIMATAKVSEVDRLIGLELGAEDYVCKPYSPRELVARVKNLLRLTQHLAQQNTPQANTSALQINPQQMTALFMQQILDLTPVEFRLLSKLAHKPGHVFSREQLMDGLYDDYRVVTARTVDSHIKNLRQKLKQICDTSEVIKSIYGVGYKYDPSE